MFTFMYNIFFCFCYCFDESVRWIRCASALQSEWIKVGRAYGDSGGVKGAKKKTTPLPTGQENGDFNAVQLLEYAKFEVRHDR